jgi:nucleotide-binding universal stress UspA family protein
MNATATLPLTTTSPHIVINDTVAPECTLLLATDGGLPAIAATSVAEALSHRWNVRPHVMTVRPPAASMDPTLAPPVNALMLQHTIAAQLASCAPHASEWTHEVVTGLPADEIVRAAQARETGLIVMGLRPGSSVDSGRLEETTLSVLQRVNVPVLAVTPELFGLPGRIAVAVDFSGASIAAARAAVSLVGTGGKVYLVYVEPIARHARERMERYSVIYAQGLAAAFVRLRQELAVRTDIAIEPVVLQGEVAGELLAFARASRIDLLAIGSKRCGASRARMLGSVTTALARTAECSLFVLPAGA